MYKKFFFILFAVLFSVVLNAQKLTVVVNYVTNDGAANKNDIYYLPGQLLSWDDFKGKPVAGSDAAALTNAGFGVKLAFRRVENTSQLVIGVHCSFSRKDSWVKPGNKTSYILNHEQKHFDIASIHTFLFMENLRKAHFTNSNYAAVIEKIYNETAGAMTKTQNQYDAETSHSRIPEKQAEWDAKISRQMELATKNLGSE
ncbi:MAG: hypothetical protein H7Z13_10265 [Ferruginibacter sp.]|nr:hypothetical protein [Ferruginibacter sp.]